MLSIPDAMRNFEGFLLWMIILFDVSRVSGLKIILCLVSWRGCPFLWSSFSEILWCFLLYSILNRPLLEFVPCLIRNLMLELGRLLNKLYEVALPPFVLIRMRIIGLSESREDFSFPRNWFWFCKFPSSNGNFWKYLKTHNRVFDN